MCVVSRAAVLEDLTRKLYQPGTFLLATYSRKIDVHCVRGTPLLHWSPKGGVFLCDQPGTFSRGLSYSLLTAERLMYIACEVLPCCTAISRGLSAGDFLTRYLQQKDRCTLRARYSPAALVAEGRCFSMRFPP